jgi:uncharacterized protein YbaP (TraB family)
MKNNMAGYPLKTNMLPNHTPHDWKVLLRLALLAFSLAGTAAMARAAEAPDAPLACPEPATPLHGAALEDLQRARPPAPDRGLLWQLEKDGRRSWLYGTMHLGRKPWLQLGPQVQQALAASDVLALEVDLTDPRTGQELAAGGAEAAAPSTPARSAQGQRRVAEQLQRVCMPATALAGAAGHLQAAALMVLAARGEGLYAEYGSERVLAMLAKRRGKSVVAVEDARSQAALLKGENDQADAVQLGGALDELESGRALRQLRRLSELWASGDADTLARYNEWCDCIHSDADRAVQQRVLTARNGPMADAFERLHRQGRSVMLAVGALHTVGHDGLAAELERRGYRVTRIQFANAGGTIPAQH